MRNAGYYSAALVILVATCIPGLPAQYSVDATVSPRLRLRPPTQGSGGGIGRKLLLQIQLGPPSDAGTPNPGQSQGATFVLTNIGTSPLGLPISPHPGDFEPEAPGAPYTVMVLSLFLTSGGSVHPLSGTVELFGDPTIPGSMLSLPPTGTLTIRTRLRMPTAASQPNGVNGLFANVLLTQRAVRTGDGRVTEESQDLGYISVQVRKAASP